MQNVLFGEFAIGPASAQPQRGPVPMRHLQTIVPHQTVDFRAHDRRTSIEEELPYLPEGIHEPKTTDDPFEESLR